MPRITLKYKSPEFEDEKKSQKSSVCEMPGCTHRAEHKAPKHRALNEYYHFCFDHAKEYNKAWDFFSGMSENEIQDHIIRSAYGDRPTWKYGTNDPTENKIRTKINDSFFSDSPFEEKEEKKKNPPAGALSPEHEAMAIMGLEPPLNINKIKERYKTLAKKHHPDLNKDNPESEELLKRINMSYTILKLAYEEFRKPPEKNE